MPSDEYTDDDEPRYQRFEAAAARINEDPARWLDRGYNQYGDPLIETVRPLIRGMRDPVRVALWLRVEHNLDREECPRSRIVEMLEERAEHLQNADLPELDGETDRDPVECDRSVTDDWSIKSETILWGHEAETEMSGDIPNDWTLPEGMEPVAPAPDDPDTDAEPTSGDVMEGSA